jgi:predicted RNase H-like HicB family nuclease
LVERGVLTAPGASGSQPRNRSRGAGERNPARFACGHENAATENKLKHQTHNRFARRLLAKNSICLDDGLNRTPKLGKNNGMKLSVTIDRDEDGMWVVECPSIPGCASQGKTKAEALKNIREAIALCLEVRAERGLPLTVETRQVEVLV